MSSSKAQRLQIMRKLDLFGYQPSMLYDKQDSFKTRYGGVVTTFVAMCYALIAVFSIWRYLDRSSPQTNINKIYVKDPVGFNLTKEILPIAFGLQDPATFFHYIDPEIYTLTATYSRFTKNMVEGMLVVSNTTIKIPVTTCDKAGLDPTLFYNLELEKMYCIADYHPQGVNLEVRGSWDSEIFGQISIEIYRCSGSHCKPDEVIDKVLQGGFFAANYINRNSRTSEYEHPIEVSPTDFFAPISTYYRKENVLWMANNEILTNSPLVSYLPPSSISYINVASLRTDISELTVDQNARVPYFYNLDIRMDRILSVTQREYSTAYDYLAEFGGLAQIITFIGFFFTFNSKKVQLYVDLVQKFARHEENYQKVLSLHSRTGRKKTGVEGKTPLSKLKTSKTMLSPLESIETFSNMIPVKDEEAESNRSSDYQQKSKRSLSNSKDESIAPEIPDERSADRNHTDAGFQETSKLAFRTAPILKRKPEGDTDSKSSSIGFQKDVSFQENVAAREKSPSPFTKGTVAFDSFWNLKEIDDNPKKENKDHLIRKIVVNTKKLGAEKQRYESVKSTLKSISGWKAVLYSYVPCLMKKTRTAAAVDIAEHDIYMKFDFVQILHFMEEFEKLKKMLLSPDQLTLFNLVPGNKLSISESTDGSKFRYTNHLDSMSGREDDIGKASKDDIVAAFDRIWNQQVHSELDQNLLVSLGFLYYGDTSRNQLAAQVRNRPSILNQLTITSI